jgi:dihydroorotase (multifunctional complex type)
MIERLLIHGGDVVTPGGLVRADVLVEAGRIAAAAPGLGDRSPGARRVDASGLTIFPGLIDAHVHLREPGDEHKEDLTTGTEAALAGGFTTVFAMPNTNPPTTDRAAFDRVAGLVERKAACDVGLYVGATPGNADAAPALAGEAVGLKIYAGSSTGDLLVDGVADQIAHFERYPADRIIAVHAEDEAAVRYYAKRGERRPPVCAALSVAHMIALAEATGRRVHICHMSTAGEFALIREAKARGVRVTCEATPHHLFLTSADEARLGPLGKVNPPLRGAEHVAALWAGRAEVDIVATDHAPHTLAEKRGDHPPSGMPGLETALPLLLTAAHEGRLSLGEVVRWLAEGPADLFGMAHKGRIAPGCDADLTLVDLDAEWTIRDEGLHTRCRWTPFAGQAVRGRVERVYLRGRLAFAGGEVCAEPGRGCLVSPG